MGTRCCLRVILHWMANLSGLPKRNRDWNASGFELLCVPSVIGGAEGGGPSRPGWLVAASSVAPPAGGGRVPLAWELGPVVCAMIWLTLGNNCGVLRMQLNKQIDAVCRMRRLVRAMVPLILYIGHADCGAWRWKGWSS